MNRHTGANGAVERPLRLVHLAKMLFKSLTVGSLLMALGACSANPGGGVTEGTYKLPEESASRYDTAYIAEVAPHLASEPDGEYLVIRNNASIRIDMGGWSIEDSDGNRLSLGIGRQIGAGAELQVLTSCGEETDAKVFACVDQDVLDVEGDVLRLLDSGGGEVATFSYGNGAE